MAECPGLLTLAQMRDGRLARVRLVGGRLQAAQARAVAQVARQHGNGLIDLTNRGNLQIRGLRAGCEAVLLEVLRGAGLMAAQPWADRLRNIAAAPLAGLEPSEVYDISMVVERLDRALQGLPQMAALSPKFSFVIDNGGRVGLAGLAHDVGLLAEDLAAGRAREGGAPATTPNPVLRLSIAGTKTPLVARPHGAHELALAAARCALGAAPDGETRLSRLIGSKHVESTAALVALIQIQAGPWFVSPPPAVEKETSARPVMGAVRQKQAGRVALGLGVPLSRLRAEQLETLADLAEEHGTGELRLSPWQVIFLPHIAQQDVEQVQTRATQAGLVADTAFLHTRIFACAGAAGCARTQMDTRNLARQIGHALRAARHTCPDSATSLRVHVSGCRRGCAHPAATEVLILPEADGAGPWRLHQNAAPRTACTTRPPAQDRAQAPSACLLDIIGRVVRKSGDISD